MVLVFSGLVTAHEYHRKEMQEEQNVELKALAYQKLEISATENLRSIVPQRVYVCTWAEI